jgi:hypothetical protein
MGGASLAGNDTDHLRVITRSKGNDLGAEHPFYVAVVD